MRSKILIVLICLMLVNLNAQEQKIEKHNIEVSAAILPLFAHDDNGLPIYDLRNNEIEVFVNKKKVKFFLVSQNEGQSKENIEGENRQEQERVNILFIDNIFSSRKTVKNSKNMALKMIKNSSKANKFMIIALTPSGKLRYLTQPTNNKKQLKESIYSIKPCKAIFDKDLFTKNDYFSSIDKSPADRDFDMISNYGESLAYKQIIVNLRQQFVSLKYLLKTIKSPKIFFWLSEGFATGAFQADTGSKDQSPNAMQGDGSIVDSLGSHVLKIDRSTGYKNSLYSGYLINMLRDISLSVTLGGGMIYAINTGEMENQGDKPLNRGDFSLSILANESGGKMFRGSDHDLIEQKIKKETAAYYDLGLYLNKNTGKYISLKVKCLRKGVNITVAKTISPGQEFEQLNNLEKKLFLLSNFDSNIDSKSTNRIFDIKPSFVNIKAGKKTVNATMKISIPQTFRNKNLYFYQILKNKTVQTEVKLLKKVFFEKEINELKITHPVNSALTYLWYDSDSDRAMRIKLLIHKKK